MKALTKDTLTVQQACMPILKVVDCHGVLLLTGAKRLIQRFKGLLNSMGSAVKKQF